MTGAKSCPEAIIIATGFGPKGPAPQADKKDINKNDEGNAEECKYV